MKKKTLLLLCFATISMILASCGNSSPDAISLGNSSIAEKEREIDLQTALNNSFSSAMASGSKLLDITKELNNLGYDDQYNKLVESDKYIQEMYASYNDIITACEDRSDLDGLCYQIRLLKNLSPERISGNDQISIDNQKVLLQMYIQQISSSFSIMSNYMNYLSGSGEKPEEVRYYEEVPDLPTPDSCISGIIFDSEKTESGIKQYMYLIGDGEDANMNYNIYIKAIEMENVLTVDISDATAYVKKNGTMVSAMMAGTDNQKGSFLIVSFPEK